MAGSSKNRYVKSKNSNPFLDDDEVDDVDDDLFLKKAPNSSKSAFNLGAQSGYKYSNLTGGNREKAAQGFTPFDDAQTGSASSFELDSPEERRNQLLLEKRRIEERTLESSRRAIGVLHETEQVGISTAEVCKYGTVAGLRVRLT